MSLRYKALIAVLLLVALVTGSLGVYVSELYRDAEIKRIRRDLERDARSLNLELATASVVTKAALENSARSSELVRLFTDPNIELKDNLDSPAGEWRQAVNAGYALAAVDTFVADERRASVLKRRPDLAIVSFVRRPSTEANKEKRDAVLESDSLYSLMRRCFEQPGEKGKPKASLSSVMALGSAVYLVVVSPLYDGLQEFSVIGVGAVFIELSSQWVRANRSRSEEENPIQQVVFAQTFSASTLPDNTNFSELSLGLASEQEVFEATIDAGDGAQTHICRFAHFDLAEGIAASRPGFIALKNLEKELGPLATLQSRVGLAGLLLGLLGAAVAYGGAFLVIRKLRVLQDATLAVREGKFDTRVDIRGRDELAKLGDAFNQMTNGLKALGIYTDNKLATTIMRDARLLAVEGAREEGSIFFSDIKGFTGIAESLNAAQLVTLLGEYFTVMSDAVKMEGGYVDKFIGDAVMAFWGPPFVKDKSYAGCACRAAVLCMRAAAKLRETWKAQGKPPFFQRIGIATGEVTVGNIGSATKKNFTVIGDSVNLASRLEGANKLYGTEILVDERTAEQASGIVLTREIDQIRVLGKQTPVRVFQLLAMASETNTRHIQLSRLYGGALQAYRAGEFAGAIELLQSALVDFPDDGPSKWLKARCEVLSTMALPGDWEAVTTATEK